MKKEKMNLKKLAYKIVFFGTPDFVNPVLNKLEERFNVVSAVRSPQKWNDEEVAKLRGQNSDFIVVASFGQILPGKVLNIPKIAPINIHPSLLPKYRGPSPIQTAILNGDEKTGVTIIKMDEEVDHGPILEQFEEPIQPKDTFESLAKRLFELSATSLINVLNDYDGIQPKSQDDSKTTKTKLLSKQDGFINQGNLPDSEKLNRMIRAYHPWPGVWTKFNLGKESVVKLLPNEQIQVEGKKPMSYKDFINGYEKGEELLRKLNLLRV